MVALHYWIHTVWTLAWEFYNEETTDTLPQRTHGAALAWVDAARPETTHYGHQTGGRAQVAGLSLSNTHNRTRMVRTAWEQWRSVNKYTRWTLVPHRRFFLA
jgi:hypothetical protein